MPQSVGQLRAALRAAQHNVAQLRQSLSSLKPNSKDHAVQQSNIRRYEAEVSRLSAELAHAEQQEQQKQQKKNKK